MARHYRPPSWSVGPLIRLPHPFDSLRSLRAGSSPPSGGEGVSQLLLFERPSPPGGEKCLAVTPVRAPFSPRGGEVSRSYSCSSALLPRRAGEKVPKADEGDGHESSDDVGRLKAA